MMLLLSSCLRHYKLTARGTIWIILPFTYAFLRRISTQLDGTKASFANKLASTEQRTSREFGSVGHLL